MPAPRLGVIGVLLIASAVWFPAPTATQPAATDWPRWRGARFDGTATTGSRVFAQPFALKVRWKRALGAGYSGVVVSRGTAVTMFSDGAADFLVALASDSGDEKWRLRLGATFPARDGSTGGPVSTPAIDEGTVFALGPHGDLVAVNLATGKSVWRRQLAKELGAEEPHWGFTTSPLVAGPAVIVLTGGSPDRAVTAFDKRTGDIMWRTGSDVVSYQSPILAKIGGAEALVAGGDQYLFALDPRTGRQVWKYEHGGRGFYGRIINPVVTAPDRLLLTYRPDESVLLNTAGQPEVTWSSRELKLNYASPVVHNGFAFGYSGAFLSAVDIRTGALAWRSRAPGDGFPIIVDGHLVVLTKQGVLAVAEATGSAYKEKASIELFTRLAWTPPSFAEGRIYARDSYEGMAAVDIVPASAMTTPAPTTAATLGRVPGSDFGRWVAGVENAPDGADKVRALLATQRASPIIEGDRLAHIIYSGPETGVVLRADVLETGRDLPLQRVGSTNLFYASLELPPDARVAYHFVKSLGEAFVDPLNPLQGASLSYAAPTSFIVMPRATRDLPGPAAALRGRLVETEIESPTEKSAHLTWGGKRKVRIHLPPGYDAEPARRYPVIYVLYGDQMLGDGGLRGVLEREMSARVRPAVAVFVDSTNPYEYARTFRSAHIRMMTEQIVPLIDRQFRTLAEPSHRILWGADEAGYSAVETGLRHPQIFGQVIAQSIFPLTSGDVELLALADSTPKSAQRFYLDWGVYDPRRASDALDVPGFTRAMSERLRARGFDVTSREWNDGSAVPFWTERSVHALRLLLPPMPAR